MNQSQAIVLVTTSYPIAGNGSEAAGSFVADLATELARHCPVRVVAPGGSSDRQCVGPNLEIFRYPAPERPLSTLKPWHPADLRKIFAVLKSGQSATRKAVLAGPTRHILALWALPSGHWAQRISRETDVPYSTWTLGSDIWSLGHIPLIRSRIRQVLSGSRRIYSDGHSLAEATTALGGGCAPPAQFMPSTRHVARTRIEDLRTSPPYRLLFLGRWHSNKGVDILLSALNRIDEQTWQKIESVTICGGGPLAPLVHNDAGKLSVAGRPVSVRGFLDKASAETAILNADWLLIPSRIESIPVVFSDAIKLGCPVLATPVGDLPRLLNPPNACGLLADEASANGYAALITKAVHDSPARYAAAMAEYAHVFSLQLIAARIVKELGSAG